MEISGHRTAEVFRRYDITDEQDLAEVAAALDRKREADLSQLCHNSFGFGKTGERQPSART